MKRGERRTASTSSGRFSAAASDSAPAASGGASCDAARRRERVRTQAVDVGRVTSVCDYCVLKKFKGFFMLAIFSVQF